MKMKAFLLMMKNTLRYKYSMVKNWITAYFAVRWPLRFSF